MMSHGTSAQARVPILAVCTRVRRELLISNEAYNPASLDGLHGSDGVQFVPAMIDVVNISTPD